MLTAIVGINWEMKEREEWLTCFLPITRLSAVIRAEIMQGIPS